ncbi:MAG: tetratricopeptide repeat protein [Candidatus Glassbacteria bacterium]|nr:tetratricopeptide repeat protein [Candidatus Glassbacteria bacterium]
MLDLALIGRDKELNALGKRIREFLDSPRKRQALWIHVFGEEGIGKTRLISELVFLARQHSHLRYIAPRADSSSTLPFGTFSSALAADLEMSLWESEYARKEKLEARLAAFTSFKFPREIFDAETTLPVLGQLLGVGYPVEFYTGIRRSGRGKLQVFNAVRHYLQATRATAGGDSDLPVTVLHFDDLERVEVTSLELLVHLVHKKEHLWPLLILTSSTRPFSARFDYLQEFQEFSLGRLSRHSRRKLLAELEEKAGGGALTRRSRDAVIEGSPGNPLFLIESYRLLAERDSEKRASSLRRELLGALQARTRALDVIDISGLVRERLRHLDSLRRGLLQAVAVLGPYSCVEMLAGLLSRGAQHTDDLEGVLASLADRGLLMPHAGPAADGSVRFVHPLVADIVLDTIPADRLSTLRQHCAEMFFALAEDEGRDMTFATAAMLSGAWLLKSDWAVEMLFASGERLLLLEDYEGAERSFEEALARNGLELTGSNAEEAAAVHALLMVKAGRAVMGTGRSKKALGMLGAAHRLAAGGGHPNALFEASLALGEMMQVRGDWDGAARYFEESRAAAFQCDDPYLKIKSLLALGNLQIKREDYDKGGKTFGRALKLCGKKNFPDQRLEALLNAGFIQQRTGEFDKARSTLEEALELARERRDETAAVTALSNLGRLLYEQENTDQALELFHKALEALRNSGDLQQTGNWLGYIGSVYFSLQEYETAIDYYRQALSLASRSGNIRNQGVWLANLGNAYYEIKEVAKALEHYLRALEFAREEQDYSYVATLLSTIGIYYYNLRLFESALRYFDESLHLARQHGNLPVTIQDLLYWGEVLDCLGRHEEGARMIEEGESLAADQGMDDHLAVASLFRAQAGIRTGRLDDAREYCRKAREIAEPTGNEKLLAEIGRAMEASGANKEGKKKKT